MASTFTFVVNTPARGTGYGTSLTTSTGVIINHWYTLSKQKGQSVDDFIVDFTKHFLMPHQKGLFTRMREKQRRLLVGTLSQEEFFTANFGSKPYTSKRHNQVRKRWEE